MREIGKEAGQLLKTAPRQLQLCFKLAELEREWAGVVGEDFAGRSSPAGCHIEEGAAVVTLRAADAATAASMNFLKPRLTRMFKEYLEIAELRVEIKVGKPGRAGSAKPPAPVWKRRAPVHLSEEAVKKELEFTSALVADKELAAVFARLKALVERRSSRRK